MSSLFPGHLAPRPATPTPRLRALAEALPARVRLGTSSWSFPGWVGTVWERPCPSEELSARGLSAYAAHPLLRTVSVDRSYYAPVPPATWAAYAEQVPDDFSFVVKAPASVTAPTLRDGSGWVDNPDWLHLPRLLDELVGPASEALGAKLGGVLVQLPPGPTPATLPDRIAEVLGGMGVAAAVEARGQGFDRDRLGEAVVASGAVSVLSVHPSLPDLRTQWRQGRVGQGGTLWVRWNLGGGLDYEGAKKRFAPFDRMVAPDTDIRDKLARAMQWFLQRERDVVVVANNKAEGCAPATLEALAAALLGLDVGVGRGGAENGI